VEPWRINMHCVWGKRDGMKTIRVCTFRCEFDMETLVCTRGRNSPMDLLAVA
jgi:hypothetical protein